MVVVQAVGSGMEVKRAIGVDMGARTRVSYVSGVLVCQWRDRRACLRGAALIRGSCEERRTKQSVERVRRGEGETMGRATI